MNKEITIENALVQTREFSDPKKLLDLDVDLLFLGKSIEYKDLFKDYLNSKGVNVKNIAGVISDLYPSGEISGGEIKPGLRKYRINDIASAGEHQFSGDELNPNNILIIIQKSIRYGRQFNEVCEVLEKYLGRDLNWKKVPTFAYIGRLRNTDDGYELGHNLFVPVLTQAGGYLPFHF